MAWDDSLFDIALMRLRRCPVMRGPGIPWSCVRFTVRGVQGHVESRRPRVCVGGWRHLRAASVSLTAVGLAVGGHLYGGGTAPRWGAFAIVWALAALVSWHLSRRRWSVRTLIGALVLTQAAMHCLCSLQGDMAMAHGGATMLTGHLVATGVSVTCLRYGEATACALAEVLLLRPVGVASRLATPVVVVRRRTYRVHAWREARSVAAWLRVCADPLRGPPAVA